MLTIMNKTKEINEHHKRIRILQSDFEAISNKSVADN